ERVQKEREAEIRRRKEETILSVNAYIAGRGAAPMPDNIFYHLDRIAEAADLKTNQWEAEAADAVEADVVNEVSEEVPLRRAPEPEAIETKPLNLRQDRYLDETPQEPDWADEEDEFDDYEDGDEALSTLAEVFIPLHDDTTGAIVRKGMVIVSLIVILCCIVAIVMKQTSLSGIIMPDISALKAQVSCAASIALSNL
ncbi:MAG: hypothetical protein II911_04925, partial [Clostridia bacterium]|nr:hypothetical protein [Clostridia bacterium]